MVTDVGDLGPLVTAHGMGVVSRPEAEAFAAQTAALSSDPARRDALGAAARRAAEGPFSWNRLVDDLERVYEQVLEPKAIDTGAART